MRGAAGRSKDRPEGIAKDNTPFLRPAAFALLLVSLLLVADCSGQRIRSGADDADVPFIPTPEEAIVTMLKLARVTADDSLYDLGSGDGRIVIAAARDFGARGVGVEIDPALVAQSIEAARRAGVGERARFLQEDLYTADPGEASVVTLFLLPGINEVLRPKLLRQLRPGARIVSYLHDMGEWQPDRTVRTADGRALLWIVPARVAGTWQLSIPAVTTFPPVTLSFRQFYQELTGKAYAPGRGKIGLRSAALEGSKIDFSVLLSDNGWKIGLTFSGRVDGDGMAGDVEVSGGPYPGSYTWRATRSAEK